MTPQTQNSLEAKTGGLPFFRVGELEQLLQDLPEKTSLPIAEQVLLQSLEAGSDDPRLLVNLGMIQMELKKFESAYESFSRAIDLDPKNAYAYACIGTIILMNAEQTIIEDSSRDDRQQIPAEDGIPFGNRHHREIYRAAENFVRAIEIDPQHYLGQMGLGRIYALLGNAENSVRHLEEALYRDADGLAYLNLSFQYAALGQPERALKFLNQAIQLFPDSPMKFDLHTARATNYINIDRYTDAEEDLGIAHNINPRSAEVDLLQAQIRILQLDHEKARGYLDAAYAKEPNYPEPHLEVAAVLRLEGDVEGALSKYRQALQTVDAVPVQRRFWQHYVKAIEAARGLEKLGHPIKHDYVAEAFARGIMKPGDYRLSRITQTFRVLEGGRQD